MANYPYIAADGTTRWACCESTIGPTCEHQTLSKQTNDIESLVLVYRNDDGELFEQRATDLVSSGTLCDDNGDLYLVGWKVTDNA